MNAGVCQMVVLFVGVMGMQTAGFAQTELLNGIAVDGHGRIAGATFRPYLAEIGAGAIPPDPDEVSVQPGVAAAKTAHPVGWIDLHLLDREIAAKFESLDHCRVDAARRKQVVPSMITADTLTLRWTILGQGQVGGMSVIASTPVDTDVLDCVKRDAIAWRFTAPTGGDLSVERAFVFRLLR